MHLGFFFFFKGGRGMKKQNLELFCVEKMGGMKACASKCKHNAPPANRQTDSNTPTPSKLSEPLTII